MISHDLGMGFMVNHDIARLIMILAIVLCLRTLGKIMISTEFFFQFFSYKVFIPCALDGLTEAKLDMSL